MLSPPKLAIESTPVCDSAVGQEDKTTASRGSKRQSSDVNAVQEDVGCPRKQKSRRLSHASSRPEGRHDEHPLQPSLVLTTPAPLGRLSPPGTNPDIGYLPHTRTTLYLTTTNNNNLRLEPSLFDSVEVDDADAGLFEPSPQGSGNKKQFSFFDFPAEIRNIIYDYSLHWPDCVDLYRTFYRQNSTYPTNRKRSSSQYQYQRNFRTPTILLLCRRINDESLLMLKCRWLVIDRLPPFVPSGLMSLTDFIGRRTLQSLHYIDIRIGLGEGPLGSGWIWMRLLDELLTILEDRNAFVKFRLLIRLCDRQIVSRWDQERKYRKDIGKKMRAFEQANPNVFAPGQIIKETWRIEGEKATFVCRHPGFEDEDVSQPPNRTYPDREMFPGSIMQFVKALPARDWSDAEVARRPGGQSLGDG